MFRDPKNKKIKKRIMSSKGKGYSIIKIGDLVERGSLMFIVLEIGDYEHYGFCRVVPAFALSTEYWIASRLLEPL